VKTNAGPSTPHPSDEDLSLGTPVPLRSAEDDKLFVWVEVYGRDGLAEATAGTLARAVNP